MQYFLSNLLVNVLKFYKIGVFAVLLFGWMCCFKEYLHFFLLLLCVCVCVIFLILVFVVKT